MSNNKLFLANYGSPDHIHGLIKNSSVGIIATAKNSNPHWNTEHSNVLANSDDIEHRIIGSDMTNNKDSIDRLINDDNYNINAHLSKNPNLDDNHIHKLIDRADDDRFVQMSLSKNSLLKSEHIKRLSSIIHNSSTRNSSLHNLLNSNKMDKESLESLIKNPLLIHNIQDIKKSEVYKKHFPNE